MDAIVFVYNADSGVFQALKDTIHKIISPETYACRLCAITYGNLRVRNKWEKFIRSIPA